MRGLPHGRGPRSRCGHPEREVLHELSSGDRQGQAGNQEGGGLSSARRRHSLGEGLRLQRLGPRQVQSCAAHTRGRGMFELPWRHAAANNGGAGG